MKKYKVKIKNTDQEQTIQADSELEARVKFCEKNNLNYTHLVGEIPCKLQYSSHDDETADFEDAIQNLDYVFDKCFSYANRVWGSTDYKGQCLAFIKVYKEHFDELQENYVKEKRPLKRAFVIPI